MFVTHTLPRGQRLGPLAGRSWYRGTGEGGVIVRFATWEGMQVKVRKAGI